MGDCQQQCSERVQGVFYNGFYNWGHFVARKPIRVILISFILALAASARLFMSFSNPLPSETEQDKLWVPTQAQAVTDKAKYDAIFNNTFRRNTVYFTTNPPGGNVLTKSVLEEIRRFDVMVTEQLNASAWGAGDDRLELTDDRGRPTVQYDDVCAQSSIVFGRNLSDPNDEGGMPCILFGHPFEIFYSPGGFFNFDYTDATINAFLTAGRGPDLTMFPPSSNRTVNVGATYGGIERDPVTNAVLSAKSVSITYLLAEHVDGTVERDAALAWEDQLNYLIGADWTAEGLSEGSASGTYTGGRRGVKADENAGLLWDSSIISMFPSTSGATSRELGLNIRADLTALQTSFIIIVLYAVFIFGNCRPVGSRSLLGLAGCVSVGLSVAVAYGFSTLVGLKLNPVVNVLPFILLGVGVDDMFVLRASLDATDVSLPVKERMARAVGKAGVSITITSLTDVFAFLLGTTSQLPALSTFCGFAAIGITADYLLQISFFVGWMALDAYREEKRKIDCCPCCCNVVIQEEKGRAKSGFACFKCCYDHFDGLTKLGLTPFLRKFYIPLLRNKVVKVLVLVVFVVYAAFSGWAASNLKQDFKFRWFVNDDAKLQETFDIQDKYFANTGLPISIVTPGSAAFDYTTIANQKKVLNLGSAIEANEYVEVDSLSSWYPGFREWIHECGETVTISGTPCVNRACTVTFGGGGARPLYPHCSSAKNQRDVGGNEVFDANGREVPGPADVKFLVDETGTPVSDSTPIAQTYVPPAKFSAWLDQYLTDAPLGGIMASEVIYQTGEAVRDCSVASSCELKATRIRANYMATTEANDQVASMKTMRTAVNGVEAGDSFPYMFMYLYYEQYAIIGREAVLNLALALVAVFVITLVIIANLKATVMVMLCVLMVDVDILGLMWLWGLTIDSVAIVNLVLAVGLALDYSAHIAHAFCQARGTLQERTDLAIEEMGSAIIHGAFSTFLAVLILSSSKSYIFRVFFKQFFGICVFGGLHGLLFLPVLLSVLGPAEVEVIREAPATSTNAAKGEIGVSSTASAEMSPPTVTVIGAPVSNPPSAPSSEYGDLSPKQQSAPAPYVV